ncbi:MICOS complex subunit Mic10-like [Cimex lectularius]|uniref:MICOS complex subunit MIC10 n=1 Tax=Cimex lectularius TaxID=79782 RepID=A0A8I6RYV0_CIMLE|nr:MICOS complex subunit Mic10-like [Cimex lectularius]
MAKPVYTENELGRRWDRCLADGLIKFAAGVVVGGVSSLMLFKRKKWPVIMGAGFGFGLAYGNCERELNSVMTLRS